MAEAYGISPSSMSAWDRKRKAMIAAGVTVQPWQEEAFYKSAMEANAGRQVATRGLSLQAARDAAQKEQFGVTSAAQAARDAEAALMNAEARRMNTVNTRLAEDQIGAGKEASYANLAGTLGGTAGLYYLMKPGAKAAAKTAAGTATAANTANTAPSGFWYPGQTSSSSSVVGEVVPEMLGMPGAPVTTTGVQVGKGLTEGALETGGTGSGLTGINEAVGAGVPLAGAYEATGTLAPEAISMLGASEGAPMAAAPAAGTSWLGPAALAAVGLRMIGKNQTNDLAALRTPITGLGELGTKYLGDTTGIKEISEVGRWLPRIEEKVWSEGIEKPIGQVFEEVKRWFCFVKGTMVEMEDGTKMPVDRLDLGDRVKEGGAVIGTGKILSDNLYEYHGQVVEGNHAALEDGKWIRVKNSGAATLLANTEVQVIYPIITENHLMIVGGRVYADLCETNQGWNVTDVERLMYLNNQKTINKHLMETYEN